MSIELVTLSNHLILCRPLLLLLSIFPSIRVFFNESALHPGWPKYWSFSFITITTIITISSSTITPIISTTIIITQQQHCHHHHDNRHHDLSPSLTQQQ